MCRDGNINLTRSERISGHILNDVLYSVSVCVSSTYLSSLHDVFPPSLQKSESEGGKNSKNGGDFFMVSGALSTVSVYFLFQGIHLNFELGIFFPTKNVYYYFLC